MKKFLKNVPALTGALAICVMAAVLLSGRATINFTHTPVLQKIHEDNHYKIIRSGNTVRVYLSTSIDKPEVYRTLIDVLLTHTGTVEMYMAGYGGRVDSAVFISNSMLNSKANVVVILYGNVSSAHAMIASNGNEIVPLNPFIKMMFHRPAVYDRMTREYIFPEIDCKKYINKRDRGVSYYRKCLDYAKNLNEELRLTVLARMYRALSVEQLENYRQGHDVFIYASEFVYNLGK